MKKKMMSTFTVMGLMLMLSMPSPAFEPHPEIHEALEALHKAKAHLERASHDFHGHRVDAIRAAYLQTLKDPEFVDGVLKQGLDLDPIGADEIAGVVRGIYALPDAAVNPERRQCPGVWNWRSSTVN